MLQNGKLAHASKPEENTIKNKYEFDQHILGIRIPKNW
jgi:hypothetical protein